MEAIIGLITDWFSCTSNYIIADISTWNDRASIFVDLSIGISAIYAIAFGVERLKVYLDDDLKHRIQDMRSSNKSTHEFVVSTIETIEAENRQHKDIRPITQEDIEKFIEIATKIGERAINANTTSQTLIFLLRRVLNDLEVSYDNDEYQEKIFLNDINRFLHSVLIEVMLDTGSVFEIPEIAKSKGDEPKRKFEYSRGINLSQNSEPVLKFYDITIKSRNEYLTQSLLVNLGSNYPLFVMLRKYRVYIPLILRINPDDDVQHIFPRPPLQLIRVRLEPKKFLFFTYYQAVNASYSPISRNVIYLQDRKALDVHKNKFYDLIFDEKLDPEFFNDASVKGKQIVNIKLQPKHSKFLWGYKRFALKKWVEKHKDYN